MNRLHFGVRDIGAGNWLARIVGEDDRLARHFAERPGSPYRRRNKAG